MKRLILILLAGFLLLTVLVVVAALVLGPALGLERRVDFDAPGILAIELDGLVVERAAPDLLSAEFEGAQHELLDLALALDRAATDDRIAGVYLRVGAPGYGWAKAEELRARLAAFRARGKFVYAYTTWTDELGYYVASAADSIYLLPDGMLDLNGFRAETPFIRPLLEKLGLEPQVEAIGAYKSAADMLRRDNMSDAEREVTGAILGERYERFLDAATAGRRVDRARFAAALDQGVYLARDLEALRLVDGQRYEADVRRLAVARARGVEPDELAGDDDLDASFVDVRDYAADLPDPPGDVEGTVGLVYAVGAITGGDSGYDPVFGRTMGARSTIEMLENVARDDALDAVVLRVDSPGGDALASEEIWAAIEELKTRLPVIVSMGDVAGSGGYYIAAGAETIVAAPSTITGSIGVLGVIFNAEGTWDKLGIRWDTVKTNPAADFPTSTRTMTDAERATFRDLIADIYRSFLERVAAGRGRTIPEIDAVAQGRIWSGTQASERGLVDEVGGLETALVAARRAAGLDPDARVALHIYPAEQTLMERLRELAMLQGVRGTRPGGAAGVRLAGGARITDPTALGVVRELAALVTGIGAALRDGPGRPLTVMPFVPTIR